MSVKTGVIGYFRKVMRFYYFFTKCQIRTHKRSNQDKVSLVYRLVLGKKNRKKRRKKLEYRNFRPTLNPCRYTLKLFFRADLGDNKVFVLVWATFTNAM